MNSLSLLPYTPTRSRLLSLWNPLDYLVLLYWMFYFPQALRWYSKRFDSYSPWRGVIIQVLLISSVVIFLTDNFVPSSMNDYSYIIFLTIFIGIVMGIGALLMGGGLGDFVAGITSSLISFSLWICLLFVITGQINGFVLGTATGIAVGISISGTVWGVGDVDTDIPMSISVVVMVSLVICMVTSSVPSMITILEGNFKSDTVIWILVGAIVGPVAAVFTSLRFDAMVTSFLMNLLFRTTNNKLEINHSSPIQNPNLINYLTNKLDTDWRGGLNECEHILLFSLQFSSVGRSIRNSLNKLNSEDLLKKVSEWCSSELYTWNVVLYQCLDPLENINDLDRRTYYLSNEPFKLNHTTSVQAVCAGFWYLHKKQLKDAVNAFSSVRHLPNGEELYANAVALNEAKPATLGSVLSWRMPIVASENLLRPGIRDPFIELERIALRIAFIVQSNPASQRITAFYQAHKDLNQLATSLSSEHKPESTVQLATSLSSEHKPESTVQLATSLSSEHKPESTVCPTPERFLMIDIARTWISVLDGLKDLVDALETIKEASSPYIVGAIVPPDRLMGRDPMLKQISSIWSREGPRDSIVVYGHRRMGKSSFVRSLAAKCELGEDTSLAVFSLQTVDWSQGLSNLSYIFAYELWKTRPDAVAEPQSIDYFMNPVSQLRKFLSTIDGLQIKHRYIIILDEYETIDEKLPGDMAHAFIENLRGFTQEYSWLAVALVGLHILRERSANYYHVLYSWQSFKVGFIDKTSVSNVLRVKDDNFPLEYTDDAIVQVAELTGGQPYLVQLMGESLVQNYNIKLSEGKLIPTRSQSITNIDLVIKDYSFFQKGEGYFRGIWGQAAEYPLEQHTVLRVLAASSHSLTTDALAELTGVETAALTAALQALADHDVLRFTTDGWVYTVPLMQRWVDSFAPLG